LAEEIPNPVGEGLLFNTTLTEVCDDRVCMHSILNFDRCVTILTLIDSFFVKELIILTPSGVDFTTVPVTESCVLQSLDCIFLIIKSQRLRNN